MNEFLSNFKQTQWFEEIQKQISSHSFSHAHLVLCDDALTASIFAKLIALTLLCTHENACFSCAGCLQVMSEVHADLFVFPKGNSFLVSDATSVVEKAYTKPIFSNKKVFLIDHFDSANTAAQNKILKVLEEPTPNTFFVMSASNGQKILPTIKSRMQVVSLPAFSQKQLLAILEQHGKTPSGALLAFSQGYLGKAMALTENNDFVNGYDFAVSMLKNMKTSKDIIKYTTALADKNTFLLKLEILQSLFRSILLMGQNSDLVESADKLLLDGLEKEFSMAAILRIGQKIVEAKTFFEANVSLNTICDNLLLGILEVKYLWK